MNPEAIYAALFAKVENLAGLKSSSRIVRIWTEVPPVEQPALIQEQTGIKPSYQGEGLPAKWRLTADLRLYVHTQSDPKAVPATALNNLIAAAIVALQPDILSEEQTLGGLAVWCRISGEIEISEGIKGGQTVAFIPIEIFAV